MELVFCIGSDRRRKMKTHPVIDVAQLLWHRDTSPKINLMKEKSFRQTSKNAVSLAQIDLGYCDSAGKRIEPLPVGLGREQCGFTRDCP
jgi:hypothetical protein